MEYIYDLSLEILVLAGHGSIRPKQRISSSRPAWSRCKVPGQLGLHKKEEDAEEEEVEEEKEDFILEETAT